MPVFADLVVPDNVVLGFIAAVLGGFALYRRVPMGLPTPWGRFVLGKKTAEDWPDLISRPTPATNGQPSA